MNQVIDVFIPRRGRRLWTYKVDPNIANSALAGYLVVVPFARQTVIGMLAGEKYTYNATYEKAPRLRRIQSVSEHRILSHDLWQTLQWLSRYYLLDLPVLLEKLINFNHWQLLRQPDNTLRIQHASGQKADHFRLRLNPEELSNSKKVHAVLAARTQPGIISYADFAEVYRQPTNAIATWRKKGWLEPIDPLENPVTLKPNAIKLTQAQSRIVKDISQSTLNKHLIQGVTGSGKTEIYAELAKRTLAAGKNVLVLLPEIALAGDIRRRLAERLGTTIGLWHSAMAKGHRASTIRGIRNGSLRIIVGARSALFSPLDNLGLIVVDEEHDGGYQIADGLNLNVRDAAVKRADFADCRIVLGSATPAIQLAHAAQSNNEIEYHQLLERAKRANLPSIKVVDTQSPTQRTQFPWLTKTLQTAITDRLEKREQIILFRNRRGFHPVIICDQCGDHIECNHCSAPLTLHARPRELRCHLCGSTANLQRKCASCGSSRLVPIGAGTQRVVEELVSLFPTANIDRLDRDTNSSATRVQKILENMQSGNTDILVGTQMVTKGLDIDNVTLVGVINIDGSLNQADYRASERAFQHLSQVSGRAGRGKLHGEVIIQSRYPEHPIIRAAANQSYAKFLEFELRQRKLAGYPPFGKLARILWTGEDVQFIEKKARSAVAQAVKRTEFKALQVLGPSPANLERVANRWRWHAIAKSSDTNLLRQWAAFIYQQSPTSKTMRCEVQIDPTSLM